MKHTFKQIFHSGKFVLGFCIFSWHYSCLSSSIQSLLQTTHWQSSGRELFPPGIYVNSYDSIDKPSPYILNLPDAAAKRIVSKLSESDRQEMKDWLLASGIPENEIDTTDTAS